LSYKGFQERTEQSIKDFDDPDALGFRQNESKKEGMSKKERRDASDNQVFQINFPLF
jgi:hypothetical protein